PRNSLQARYGRSCGQRTSRLLKLRDRPRSTTSRSRSRAPAGTWCTEDKNSARVRHSSALHPRLGPRAERRLLSTETSERSLTPGVRRDRSRADRRGSKGIEGDRGIEGV